MRLGHIISDSLGHMKKIFSNVHWSTCTMCWNVCALSWILPILEFSSLCQSNPLTERGKNQIFGLLYFTQALLVIRKKQNPTPETSFISSWSIDASSWLIRYFFDVPFSFSWILMMGISSCVGYGIWAV